MSIRLACVGNLTTDNIVSCDGTRISGLPGGGSLYAAIGASFWMDDVGVVSRIGHRYDTNALKRFEAYGIDFSGVTCHQDLVGIIDDLVYLDEKGDKKRIDFVEGSSEHWQMTPTPDELPADYRGSCLGYHLVSCSRKENGDWLNSLPADAVVSVDPFIAADELSARMEQMKRVNCFLPSEKELGELFQIPQPQNPLEYIPYLDRLVTDAVQVFCVKMGDRGVFTYCPKEGKAWQLPPCPSKVVNITGCGDSFCGGFMAGYIKDRDPFLSTVRGIVSSSFVIEHLLSIELSQVSRREVQTRLHAYLQLVDPKKNQVL